MGRGKGKGLENGRMLNCTFKPPWGAAPGVRVCAVPASLAPRQGRQQWCAARGTRAVWHTASVVHASAQPPTQPPHRAFNHCHGDDATDLAPYLDEEEQSIVIDTECLQRCKVARFDAPWKATSMLGLVSQGKRGAVVCAKGAQGVCSRHGGGARSRCGPEPCRRLQRAGAAAPCFRLSSPLPPFKHPHMHPTHPHPLRCPHTQPPLL